MYIYTYGGNEEEGAHYEDYENEAEYDEACQDLRHDLITMFSQEDLRIFPTFDHYGSSSAHKLIFLSIIQRRQKMKISLPFSYDRR